MARLRDGLAREWESLAARPESSGLLGQWAAQDDRLAGFESLSEVITFVRWNPSARAANGVLAALLRISADDSSARHCALGALMPGLVRLAGHYRSAGDDHDHCLQTELMLPVERIDELAGQHFGIYLARHLPAVADGEPDMLSIPIHGAAFAWATSTPLVISGAPATHEQCADAAKTTLAVAVTVVETVPASILIALRVGP